MGKIIIAIFAMLSLAAALPALPIRTSDIQETESSCNVPAIGFFGDTRSGNQHQTGSRSLGNMPSCSSVRTVTFKYKYVVGYCTHGKHAGTGPTLEMKVGSTVVWRHQINLATGDYPYDAPCGGNPRNYSPIQTATLTIPAGVGGDARLYMIVANRNIHVVGYGIQSAGASPSTACSLPAIGTFHDTRSGNQYQTGSRSLGSASAAAAAREVAFQYKYVVGYCPRKHVGTGPVLQMTIGGREVWR